MTSFLSKLKAILPEDPLLVKLRFTDFRDLSFLEAAEMQRKWPGLWNRRIREAQAQQQQSVQLELIALEAQFQAWKREALDLELNP